MLLSFLALLTVPSARADVPHGAALPDAIAADITADGFVELPLLAGALVPESIPVPPVGLSGSDDICVIPNPFGGCWVDATLYSYFVNINGIDVGVELRNLSMTPADQVIEIDATARITLNSQAAPAQVAAGVEIFELIDIDTTCDVWLEPVDVDIFTTVEMAVLTDVEGNRVVDATVSPILWSWDLQASDLQFNSCGLADIQDFFDADLFDFIGFNPWELAVDAVIDQVDSAVDGPIQDLATEIEPALEDAFAAAELSEELTLGDATMTVDVWPEDVIITPAGMRIQLGGGITSDVHPCMAPYGPQASVSTPGELPGLGSAAAGVREGHHIGVFIDDDFVNQALYSVWAGGLLCYTLSGEDDTLPVPVNTSLLNIVAGDAFAEYFPETEAMQIVTRPYTQPVAATGGNHDVTAEIRDLGLDMYAELDGRMARMIGATVETDAGIDLGWVGTTGELAVDITFDAADIEPTVTYLELAPGREADVERQLSGLMETVVDPLIGDLLTDVRIGLPSLEGLGLLTLEYATSGDGGDHIGVYGELGLVTYNNGGCDGEGCASSGASCGGGCATGGAEAPARLVYGGMLLLLLARRRRDRA